MEKKFYLYYQSILKFLHSINIKFDPFIDRINDYYLGKMDIDTSDPTTYPYYINLMGEYHANDTSIYITDFTSKAQVELNHSSIDGNVNRIIYLKDFSLYKSLLEKYPEQKHLIRCIFFPIKYTQNEAIEADNLTLLGYDDELLDEKERDNIVFDIKEFLEYFRFRWYIKTFNYEELHPMMVWAILWNVLPLFLLTKKIYYIKTGNVDNFHLWEYLLSKGLKDYTGYLTSHQNTYLYRNVEYLNKNIGKKLIIDSLDETLLEPIGLKLHNKWVLHDLTDGIENAHWNPISINKSTDNSEILRTESFQNLLDTIEENDLDRNRYLEYKDDIQKDFTFTKYNHLISKYQEIITTFKDFKYFQYYIQFVSDIIFNLIKHDRIDLVINLTNDIDTNEMISINQKDAIYILYYIYYIKNNKIPINLPKLHTSLIGINTFESPIIDDEFIYDGKTYLISNYLDVVSILDSINYLDVSDIFTDKDLLSTYIDKRFDLWIQLTINKRNSHERFQKYAVSNLINQLCVQETFEFNTDDMSYVDYFTSNPQIKSFLDKYISYRDYYDDLIYRIFEGFITIHDDIRNFIIFDVKKNIQFNKMKQLFVQFNSYLIKLLDNELIQQNYISLPSPIVSFEYIPEPITVSVTWDTEDQYENESYVMTVNAIDPAALDLTYEVVCDDPAVGIVQRSGIEEHIFDITYGEYAADANIEYMITVTNTLLTSTTITEPMIIQDIVLGDPPVINSIAWDGITQWENRSYVMTIDATDPQGLDLTYGVICDDVSVGIVQQLSPNEHIFDITYGYYNGNTAINFTVTVTNTDMLTDSNIEPMVIVETSAIFSYGWQDSPQYEQSTNNLNLIVLDEYFPSTDDYVWDITCDDPNVVINITDNNDGSCDTEVIFSEYVGDTDVMFFMVLSNLTTGAVHSISDTITVLNVASGPVITGVTWNDNNHVEYGMYHADINAYDTGGLELMVENIVCDNMDVMVMFDMSLAFDVDYGMLELSEDLDVTYTIEVRNINGESTIYHETITIYNS